MIFLLIQNNRYYLHYLNIYFIKIKSVSLNFGKCFLKKAINTLDLMENNKGMRGDDEDV